MLWIVQVTAGRGEGRGMSTWECVCVSVFLNRCHPPHPILTPNTPVEFGFAHRGKMAKALHTSTDLTSDLLGMPIFLTDTTAYCACVLP